MEDTKHRLQDAENSFQSYRKLELSRIEKYKDYNTLSCGRAVDESITCLKSNLTDDTKQFKSDLKYTHGRLKKLDSISNEEQLARKLDGIAIDVNALERLVNNRKAFSDKTWKRHVDCLIDNKMKEDTSRSHAKPNGTEYRFRPPVSSPADSRLFYVHQICGHTGVALRYDQNNKLFVYGWTESTQAMCDLDVDIEWFDKPKQFDEVTLDELIEHVRTLDVSCDTNPYAIASYL